ncbi:MAG: EAL domain-containing protein [Cocleimonas sp.]|nr:EAL domain-containing protein [Cocleimonas sp.]
MLLTIIKISNKISYLGLPRFWQWYVLLHGLAVMSYVFISHPFFAKISYGLVSVLITIGILAGIWIHHRNALFPWLLLLTGEFLITLSIVLRLLEGDAVEVTIIFWIEEVGIIFIGLFAFVEVFILEQRYHLKGFTLDLILLLISLAALPFILYPQLLTHFFYDITLAQQLLVTQVFLGFGLLSKGIIYQIFSKRIGWNEAVLLLMVSFVLLHFVCESLISFQWVAVEYLPFLSKATVVFYKLAGTLAIIFVFIEKSANEHSSYYSFQLSYKFMRVASLFAILMIPLGVTIRWILNISPLDPLFIGLTSFLLNSLVIWRLVILIQNNDKQKHALTLITQTDPLTGLNNYSGYLEKLSLKKIKNTVVFSINIDDFKSINDTYGIRFGDEVLQSLARRLEQIPEVVLVARTGVDLFLLVYKMPKAQIHSEANYLATMLGQWDTVLGRRIAVPLSYGASYREDIIKPEKHARQAEQAGQIARSRGVDFYLYRDDPKSVQFSRHELREILQKAIDRNYLPVHFQPIYNVDNGSLKAMEMLIRVDSDDYGLLQPGQFLDQAKAYGLLTALTHVCIYMISQHYAELPRVMINVNLPPYMLDNPQVLDAFIYCFEAENLPPEQFCIEITEDGDIPYEHLIPMVKRLKDKGFSIAMDDFGSGYSSLSRLSVLPIDTVKIDRSLLVSASSGNPAALDCAVMLIKRLGVSAVVEGVETLEQLLLIKSMGVDSVQGFFFSKPIPLSEVSAISLRVNANMV